MLLDYFSKQSKEKFLHPGWLFLQFDRYRLVGYLLLSVLFMMLVWIDLFYTPLELKQGQVYRIIYLHVPLAVFSLFFYCIMGINCAMYLVFHTKMSDLIAQAFAISGAIATFLVLVTGSLWAKPTWGTWWLWDGRLTSELVLLLLYLGYISLRYGIKPRMVGQAYASQVAVVGLINIPIIHYSVNWWATLHQGASLLAFQKPKIANEMLYPLLLTMCVFGLLFLLLTLHTMKVCWQRQSFQRCEVA